MKKYWAFGLLLLFSCELVVDIDVPFDGPSLTLNSVVNPDSTYAARLSLNRYILDDTTSFFLDNAQVSIEELGKDPYLLSPAGDGFYTSDLKPEAGKTYRIRAFSEKYGSIEASCTVPFPAGLIDHKVIEKLFNHQYETKIALTFQDDADVENFYQALVYLEHEWFDYQTQKVRTSPGFVMLTSDDPIIKSENEGIDYFHGVLFKDVFFNGKKHTANFRANGFSLENTASYTIALRTLTKDYYQYRFTVGLQEEASGDPFAQPVNVRNNIENGFGVFGAYSQSVYHHSNPKPVITSFSTDSGKRGDEVTIYGENFFASESDRIWITFHAERYLQSAQIVDRKRGEIRVVVPTMAVTGKIVININGRVTASETEFQVIN